MKTKPMDHQVTGLLRLEGKRNFALLMEQGTGKSWTTLADTERCFLADKIDALLVVAPNGVHTNWVRREIPNHLEVPCVAVAWRGRPTTKKAKAELASLYDVKPVNGQKPLVVFTINIDAVNTEAGYEAAKEFLETYRCIMVVDESTRIKNPSSKRTKKVTELGKLATARRILSGTPLTKAPTDLFAQFNFLKPGLLGTTSYRAFVAEYSVLMDTGSHAYQAILRKIGGRGQPQIVDKDDQGNPKWRNLEQLSEMIAPHSYRVRKDECLSLPDKIYKSLYFQLDPSQRRVYDELQEDYSYVSDGETLNFEAIATRTKLKQVTSGFINVNGAPEFLGSSGRMSLFKEALEDLEGQFIVWAMFEEEIKQVLEVLEEFGISCVSYYGATSKDDREKAIDDFQDGRARAFVGHAQAAGIGLTLTAAETAIYYSCSHDNELRMQSEDRCHRIGTKKSVVYIDIVAEDTIDEDVVRSLAFKTNLANKVIDRK